MLLVDIVKWRSAIEAPKRLRNKEKKEWVVSLLLIAYEKIHTMLIMWCHFMRYLRSATLMDNKIREKGTQG
jgi:hypothetical protein